MPSADDMHFGLIVTAFGGCQSLLQRTNSQTNDLVLPFLLDSPFTWMKPRASGSQCHPLFAVLVLSNNGHVDC